MSEIRRNPAFSGDGGHSEQIQGHPVQDGPEFERLHDQLADLLFPEDDGEIDSEALDALLDRMEEVCPLPASLSTDPEEGLERFRRRYGSVMEDMAADTAPDISPVPGKRHSVKPFARALPFAAALILLLGTVTAQAFGVDVFSAIARWTAEIFRLDGGSTPYAVVRLHPLDVGEEATYESLEEAVAAFGIDAPIVPKEIPEGFELSEVEVANEDFGILINANYRSDDGFFQIRYKETSKRNVSILEKEYKNVTSYFAGGITHYLLSDLGRQKAIWQNGDFECKLSGDISEKEMRDMINSIYGE